MVQRIWLNSAVSMAAFFNFISLAAAQEEDIRDVRGPVEYPVGPLWIMILCGIVFVILVLLISIILKKRKDKPKVSRKKVKLPWELAIDQLNRLMEKEYIKTEKFALFYTELSGILRSYLENNFSIRAPEMTTEEFLSSIGKNELLFDTQKEILKKFLSYADMVKFAKFAPTRKEAEEGFKLAKEFIEQTKKE